MPTPFKYRDGTADWKSLRSERGRLDTREEVESWRELRADHRKARIEEAREWRGRLASGRPGLRDASVATVLHHVDVLLNELEAC